MTVYSRVRAAQTVPLNQTTITLFTLWSVHFLPVYRAAVFSIIVGVRVGLRTAVWNCWSYNRWLLTVLHRFVSYRENSYLQRYNSKLELRFGSTLTVNNSDDARFLNSCDLVLQPQSPKSNSMVMSPTNWGIENLLWHRYHQVFTNKSAYCKHQHAFQNLNSKRLQWILKCKVNYS